MSMDHTGSTGDGARDAGTSNSVTDAPLMAATPIWETRGKKRRGLGRGAAASSAAGTSVTDTPTAAAEPRSFEPSVDSPRPHAVSETRPMTEPGMSEPSMASAAVVTDPMTGRPDVTDHTTARTTAPMDAADEDAGLISPIGRTRTRAAPARRSGVPAAAIAAGVVTLGALGAAGWYASQSNDGVAELTPGAAQESMALAQAPTTPAAPLATTTGAAPATEASTPTPAARTTDAAASTERRATVRTASVSRTRPAAAASAEATSATQAGIDASGTATLPTGPQPYSALNPGAATDTATTGATGSSGVTTAPSVTPAPIPSTPPIASDPNPTTASPAAPSTSTATPPTATTPQ